MLGRAIEHVAYEPFALKAVSRGWRCRPAAVESVNRILRKHTGKTATERMNDLRLSRVTHELRMADRPVPQIAASAISLTSTACRLFADRFGTTARRYRTRYAALIQGGESGNGR